MAVLLSQCASADVLCLDLPAGQVGSIAASDETLFVGYPNDALVRVFTFEHPKGPLTLVAELTLPEESTLSSIDDFRFGQSVSISGEVVVVSAVAMRRESYPSFAEIPAGTGYYVVSGLYSFSLATGEFRPTGQVLLESGLQHLPPNLPRRIGSALANDGQIVVVAGEDLPVGGARDGFVIVVSNDGSDVRFLRAPSGQSAGFASDVAVAEGRIVIGDGLGPAWVTRAGVDPTLYPVGSGAAETSGGERVALDGVTLVFSSSGISRPSGTWTADISGPVPGSIQKVSDRAGEVAVDGNRIGIVERMRGEGRSAYAGHVVDLTGAEMATAPMIQQSSHLHVAAGSGQLVFVTTDRDRSCVSMVAAD